MILLKNRDRNPSFKSGKYVEINDAGNYPMELSVDGVCEQETTSGKNLLPNTATTKTISGLTFTKNEDGTILVNGTASANINFDVGTIDNLTLGNTYHLCGCPSGGSSSTYRLFMSDMTTGSTSEFGSGSNYNIQNTKVVVRIIIQNGTTVNNLLYKPMVSTDTTLTYDDYEPYTGGQASPNPDYPQEIKTIENSLKITSCNKNLLNVSKYSDNNYFSQKLFIPVGEYTVKYIGDTSDAIYVRKANGTTPINGTPIIERYNINQLTFTITESGEYYIQFYKSKNGFTLFENAQLEKGTQATPFEQHLETQIQANLPEGEFIGKINDTYKDTLKVEYNEDDGHYHLILNKMIGKLVLNGSENWLENPTYKGIFMLTKSDIVQKYNNVYVQSNYFLGVSNDNFSSNISTIDNSATNYGNTRLFIAFRKYQNNLNGFKAWLSTHNVEVYYALATSYDADLEIVDTLLSYDNITNIFTDSNLLPVINVKYYKDFKFDKILRSGYNIDEQEYEIAKKQMANGKRKKILSSYVDCIIKINLGLLDNKTYQEYKEQLEDGEYEYFSYRYNQYKKANFILKKPSINTEYAYDDDIGIDDMKITLEKSSDIE